MGGVEFGTQKCSGEHGKQSRDCCKNKTEKFFSFVLLKHIENMFLKNKNDTIFLILKATKIKTNAIHHPNPNRLICKQWYFICQVNLELAINLLSKSNGISIFHPSTGDLVKQLLNGASINHVDSLGVQQMNTLLPYLVKAVN